MSMFFDILLYVFLMLNVIRDSILFFFCVLNIFVLLEGLFGLLIFVFGFCSGVWVGGCVFLLGKIVFLLGLILLFCLVLVVVK